jgi:hypothetical protein
MLSADEAATAGAPKRLERPFLARLAHEFGDDGVSVRLNWRR